MVLWLLYISAISALIILPTTQSRSAILALGCSSTAFVLNNKQLKNTVKKVLKKTWMWLIPSFLIFFVVAYLFKKPSADGRLFIDKISIEAMADNGFKGVGLHHFGGAYGDTQANHFKKQIKNKGIDDLDWSAINEHERLTSDCPEYAFNEYLNIGIENGPILMALFVFIIICAIVISFKRKTIWCYGLLSFAVFAFFSYPLQCVQFKILFPVLIACCYFDKGLIKHKEHYYLSTNKIGKKRFADIFITATAFIALTPFVLKEINAVKQHNAILSSWKEVNKWYQMEFFDYVVEDCESLLPHMKYDRQFLFKYGHSLNLVGNYAKSDSILLLGTKISCDPMFWNVMGNNSLAQGNFREAEERYKQAFYMVPNRLYPLYLLSKLYYLEKDTAKFLYMTEKVESFIPKVESIKTESMRSEISNLKDSLLKSF